MFQLFCTSNRLYCNVLYFPRCSNNICELFMIVELFKKVDNLNRASRGYYSGHAPLSIIFTVFYRSMIIAIVNLKMFNLKI